MHKNLIPALLAVLLVTGMTAAAELLGNQEILFPEIAAIAAGALLSPKLAWCTDALHMLLTITLGAWAGVGIVRFVPLPLPAQMCFAFLVASLGFLFSRTTFAPMISAIVLPVMLQTESVVYPIAAMTLTLLILGARKITERCGFRDHTTYEKLPLADGAAFGDTLLRWAIGSLLIWIAVSRGAKLAAAPPLLVAFTEFWNPKSPMQRMPFVGVALIAICTGIGTALRITVIAHGFPLFLAAGVAMLFVALIMIHTGLYLPPAAALSILAFLIPPESVARFPLEVLAGASILTGIAVLQARIRAIAFQKE